MKAKILSILNYSQVGMQLKEWYELAGESEKRKRKMILICILPIFLLTYPIIRICYNKRLKKEVIECNNIYSLKKYPGIKFFMPDFENDIMQRYIFMTDNFHDHNILPELTKKYLKEKSNILDIGGTVIG